MKNIFLTAFLGVLFQSAVASDGQVIVTTDKVDDLKRIAQTLTEQDMYVSDCDGVLLQATVDLMQIFKYLKCIPVDDSPTYSFVGLASTVLKDAKRSPVSDEMRSVFNILKEKHVPAFILTACGRGTYGAIDCMEDWREEGLKQVGLLEFFKTDQEDKTQEFKDIAVPNESKTIKSSSYIPACRNRVIYTCNTPKDDVLKSFLGESRPKRLIYVDDDSKNVELIRKLCQDLKINFTGVHYTAAKSEGNVELKQLLSDLITFCYCGSVSSEPETKMQSDNEPITGEQTRSQGKLPTRSVSVATLSEQDSSRDHLDFVSTHCPLKKSTSFFDLSEEHSEDTDESANKIRFFAPRAIPPRCCSVGVR